MRSSVHQHIIDLLDSHQVVYKALHHEPTLTSGDAARVRNEDLSIGGKAILLKVDRQFALFVVSASKKIDSKCIRKQLAAKKTRFASKDELLDLTSLVPGSVPPFGRPILAFDLYVDRSIFENERIAFNTGSLTDSIIMSTEDYRRLANPTVLDFSASP